MIKTDEEIKKIRNVCKVTAFILKTLIRETRVGDTGLEINNRACHLFDEAGIETLFHGYQGFPAAMCISINDGVIHGIPNNDKLKNGDVVKFDIGGKLEGYCSDLARSFILGVTKDIRHEQLLYHTRKSLDNVIHLIREGKTLKDIAEEIETYARIHGLGNVTSFGGHGVGQELHEKPHVDNCVSNVKENIILKEGMVLAIEPLYTLGTGNVNKEHGWNVKTVDGSIGCHFEDCVLIKKDKCQVLTE